MARRFDRLTKEQRDELLSAYLDNQLDAEDRARLEAQLAADPALRSELEMLRRTVALVRDLPPQPIPRNFILPQTTVSRPRPAPVTRRPRWLAPFLTAATTAVSLLFVAVLAGDLLFSGVGRMTQLAVPAPDAEEVADTAPVEKAVEEEKEAPQMLIVTESSEKEFGVEEPAETGESEGLVTPCAESAGTPLPAVATLPEASVGEGDAAPTPTPDGTPVAPAGGGGELPTKVLVLTPTFAAAKEADATARGGTPEADEIAPAPPEPATAESTEQVLRDTEPAPNEMEEVEPPQGDEKWDEHDRGYEDIPFRVTPWRVAEVALGVFALLLVLATIWAWRARRR